MTYLEIYQLAQEDSALKAKVYVACLVAAEAIRTEGDQVSGHAARLAWARATFANPLQAANRMIFSALARHKALTTAAIKAAPDTTIQTAVDEAVALFATGA